MIVCDTCSLKYKCKKPCKGHYWSEHCKSLRIFKKRDLCPFNTKEYVRNPRERGYMLLKRKKDGTVYALSDQALSVAWNESYGLLWLYPIDAEGYLIESKKWSDYDPSDEMFVVRIKSKHCPVEVDFKTAAPRIKYGNVYFKLRDNAERYYKAINYLPK